jgi:hypothetical protein
MVYGIEHHFQQHFNYIMAISFIGDGVPRENYRPVVSHWQTLSHNVVSSTPRHKLLAVPYNVHP